MEANCYSGVGYLHLYFYSRISTYYDDDLQKNYCSILNGFEIKCMNIIKEVNVKPIGVVWPPLPI